MRVFPIVREKNRQAAISCQLSAARQRKRRGNVWLRADVLKKQTLADASAGEGLEAMIC